MFRNPTSKSAGKTRLVLFIFVVIVSIFVVILQKTYYSQQDKIDILNQQMVELSTKLTALEKQNEQRNTTYTSKNGVTVKVYAPLTGSKVTSPLTVVGEVPGDWSFEATFPVLLKDVNGKVIAQSPAHVLGDWITDELVPFSIKLEFTTKNSGNGTLILQKDNPSGLSKYEDSVSIPIKFYEDN